MRDLQPRVRGLTWNCLLLTLPLFFAPFNLNGRGRAFYILSALFVIYLVGKHCTCFKIKQQLLYIYVSRYCSIVFIDSDIHNCGFHGIMFVWFCSIEININKLCLFWLWLFSMPSQNNILSHQRIEYFWISSKFKMLF